MPSGISPTSPQPSERDHRFSDKRQAAYNASYQYLETMGLMEALSQINTHAKHLQKQELVQSRQGVPAQSELTASSAGQVALKNIQIELKSLKKMITLLDQKMQGDATVAKFKQELNKISERYPNLTPEDTENLNSLVGELFPFVQKMGSEKKLSQEDLGAFFKELKDMLAAVNAHNSEAMGAWEKAKDPSLSGFDPVAKALKTAEKTAQKAADFASSSLPKDFYDAILGHYMPGQEKYLMQLAEELFFSNFGTQMDTQLLNDVMGWSDSSNNYDLNNWLNSNQTSKSGTYSGSPDSARKHIKDEENQANSDLKKAEQAETDIGKQLAKITKLENEGKLTPAQAKTLRKQLHGTEKNLKQAVINLKQLITDLKTAYSDVGGKKGDKTFTLPSADANAIQNDENTVVNGTTKDKGSGLENIQANLSNDQTNWSGQSQTDQINLQMKMTEIQQEWTVVSTSLQLLNQMYMTLAKSLYQ